jgi:hypothetical protein
MYAHLPVERHHHCIVLYPWSLLVGLAWQPAAVHFVRLIPTPQWTRVGRADLRSDIWQPIECPLDEFTRVQKQARERILGFSTQDERGRKGLGCTRVHDRCGGVVAYQSEISERDKRASESFFSECLVRILLLTRKQKNPNKTRVAHLGNQQPSNSQSRRTCSSHALCTLQRI